MTPSSTDRDLLRKLLHEYNERPDHRERVAAEIDRRFRRSLAILVADSCGFSRHVRAMGIVPFLALLERLRRLVDPVVGRCGGRVLRSEADNIFAVFPDVVGALSCADAILHDLGVVNELAPSHEEIHVSIGLGYGNVLLVEPHDLYGDEMNLACKLGEDLAQRGEILLTPAARQALGPASRQLDEVSFSISGLELVAYRVVGTR
ncbi:MAG: adenylate/guanylate cyclase domain-containing protein [Chloroflexi bacterium]|nr:adenylate/guanylate cyclase domain-containing protein [Chloroflexota bacterium]